MTKEEAIYVLKNTAWLGSAELAGDVTEAVKMAVNVLKRSEAPNSSDTISRQAAIDAVTEYGSENSIYMSVGELKRRIEALPSAQPYTEAEIQKMQELEQAELQKAYECGRASAQPEIIRCKECKHQEKFFHEDKRRKEGGYYIFGCELSSEYSHVCLDEDFCSRAERRTDEQIRGFEL